MSDTENVSKDTVTTPAGADVKAVNKDNKDKAGNGILDFFPSDKGHEQNVSNKSSIRHDNIENIDHDIDLSFKLRGKGFNPLVEVASPLINLALSSKKITELEQEKVEPFYHRVRDEILVVIEEVKDLGYDGTTQLSFQYCLCTFIDELVMRTPWGSRSVWAKESMLAHYHNETWGGEKFFFHIIQSNAGTR